MKRIAVPTFSTHDISEFEYQVLMTEVTYWEKKELSYTIYVKAYNAALQDNNTDAEYISIVLILNYFISKRNLSDKAIGWVKKAQKLLHKPTQLPLHRAKLLLMLAWSEHIARKYNEALEYLDQAKKLFSEIGAIPSQWHITAAAFMFESEEYEQGWQYLFTGEETLCREWGEFQASSLGSRHEAIIRHRLTINTINLCKNSVSYLLRFRDTVLAEKYIQFGIAFQEQEKYEFDIAPLYGQLANIYLARKDFAGAQFCGNQVLKIFTKTKATFAAMYGYQILSLTALVQQEKKLALQYAEKSWKYAQKLKDKSLRCHPLMHYIECLLQFDEYIESVELLLPVLNSYFDEVRFHLFLFKKYQITSLYMQKIGNKKQAAEYITLANEVVAGKQNPEIQQKFQLAKAQQQRTILRELDGNTFVSSPYSPKTPETEQTTTHSDAAINQHKTSSVAVAELMQTLVTSLGTLHTEVTSLTKKEIQERLQSLILFIQEHSGGRKQEQNMLDEASFEHGNFLALLSQKFPSLSHTELRICVLLRMNLSTHQISNVLSITPDTVFTHRKNIRRKLAIPESEHLHTYLLRLQN